MSMPRSVKEGQFITFVGPVVGALALIFFLGYLGVLNDKEEVKEIPVTDSTNIVEFQSDYSTYDRVVDISQSYDLIIYGRDMKKFATINFGEDKVIYGGDLPVDESAKIFFEHVFGLVKASREVCKDGPISGNTR